MSLRAAAIRIDQPLSGDGMAAPRSQAGEPSARIRNAGEHDLPAPSLPVELQREVAAAVAQGAFDPAAYQTDAKWPIGLRLAFIFGTCAAFWGAAAWLVTKLI